MKGDVITREVQMLVRVSPRRVWKMLTDPDELAGWACTRARIDSRYLLEGVELPGGNIGGTITEWNDGRRLSFEWPIAGDDSAEPRRSTVTIALEEEPQDGEPPGVFTTVRISHRNIPRGVFRTEVIFEDECWDAAWTLYLRKLVAWSERARTPVGFDPDAPVDAAGYGAESGGDINRTIEIEAPRARVWEFIVNPDRRRSWLTFDALTAVVERREPEWVLYEWNETAEVTRVGFELEALSPQRTRVTVRHYGLREAFFDYTIGWHDFLVALDLKAGPEMTATTGVIDAPPERVWRFLSSEEGLRAWFSDNIRFEPRVGGTVRFKAHNVSLGGEVLEMTPNERLVFSWTEYHWENALPEPLRLSIELAEIAPGRTRVTIHHSGYERIHDSECDSYRRGWSDNTQLERLARVVTAGTTHEPIAAPR